MHATWRFWPIVCFFAALFSSVFMSAVHAADTSYGRSVLVLNSYHQGFPWSDGIYRGLVKQLAQSGQSIDVNVEYLDTKRYPSAKMFPIMADYLQQKGMGQVDVVVVTDNNALVFLQQYREQLFAGIPVVFVGINNYSAKMIAGDPLLTGLAETTDPTANIELITRLHPNMHTLLLLSDATPTGLAEQARFQNAAQAYSGRFKVQSFTDWNLSELKSYLAAQSEGTVIFRLPLHRDRDGLSMTLQESVNFLLQNTQLPIYTAWDTAIDAGLLGGYAATSTLQGKKVAQYVMAILEGAAPNSLPVLEKSPTEPVFNGEALAQHKIALDALPVNSRILHPVKREKPPYGWWALLAVLVASMLYFYRQWHHKRRELKNLNQEYVQVMDQSVLLRTLMDSNPDHIYAKGVDGRYMVSNKAFADFVGQSPEDVVGRRVEDFFPTQNVHLTNEQDAHVINSGKVQRKEIWVHNSNGEERLIECVKTPLINHQSIVIGLLAINRDITNRYFENAQLKQNSRVLDMVIRGMALSAILEEVVRGVERAYGGCLCSILLLDKDKKHLVHGAASSLPDFYIEAVDGIEIGEGVGSCGTAAATGKQIVVEDIATHPYWQPYKALAEKAELGSCWSQPILGSSDEVLGTFAVYHRHKHRPSPEHLTMMEETARLVSLAIERKQVEGNLQKLSRAVEQSPTMVIITDAKGVIEYVNEEFTEVTGYTQDEVRGLTPGILNGGSTSREFYAQMWKTIMSGHDWHGEIRNKTKTGQLFWSMLSISPIQDENGVITHFIGVSEDISAQKNSQAQIEQLAYYDPLTRLGNRRLFREQLEQELKKAQREQTTLALFYLDLDNFKQINDTLGHDMGDRLLQTIADRLRMTLRNYDLIARLGGDEFIALLPNVSGPNEAGIVAQKLLSAVCEPLQLGRSEVTATVSLGITLAPGDGRDWPVLMKNADMAMYRAKREGRNNFQFFTREMNDEVQRRANMEEQLRRAQERNEFILHYQPQWSILSDQQPVCVEALVRWEHPERGRVSPAEFIPIAEDLGLIVELGEWVLNEACRQGRHLMDFGHPLRVAVNLSTRQFFDPELLNKIRNALDTHHFPANLLELEITESMLIEDVDRVRETLEELKALGVALSIDDFGTGYSSLAYLKKLPFDHLKVDASFVRDIPHDKNDMEITAAVIAMAHKLGLKVVAEGIETHEQLAFLRENFCEMGQGYLLAKPMTMEEIVGLIDVEFESHFD